MNSSKLQPKVGILSETWANFSLVLYPETWVLNFRAGIKDGLHFLRLPGQNERQSEAHQKGDNQRARYYKKIFFITWVLKKFWILQFLKTQGWCPCLHFGPPYVQFLQTAGHCSSCLLFSLLLGLTALHAHSRPGLPFVQHWSHCQQLNGGCCFLEGEGGH